MFFAASESQCEIPTGKNIREAANLQSLFNHQTFQVPKMEESSPILPVCKGYVRETPTPNIAL